MRRFTSIILSIFLGALAVAVGMGIFLKMANDDRARLADLTTKAQQESQKAKETSQHAIQDANSKLDAANQEITKAQQALKAMEEERVLLASAETLHPATPRAMKGWQEALDLQLGVSLKFPAGSTIETNDETALTIASAPTGSGLLEDSRWLSVTPYETRLETDLINAFTTSTPVSYLVDGHLLIGRRGKIMGKTNETFVLRDQFGGTANHLIWARDPGNGSTALSAFATFSFQK